MSRYISILRGINVGGHKKILMADLKALLVNQGFENVVTYIQSGNIIIDSHITDSNKVKQKLESIIEKRFGFQVPVIVRKQEQLQNVINNDPFSEIDKIEMGSKLHVFFLSGTPAPENREQLLDYVQQIPEQLVINKNHIYVYYPNGAGRSKLTINIIEKKLSVQATARNWKTIQKLLELSS